MLVKKWLIVSCMMVVLMILIGGVTRLTNSGLSIVEWRPMTGVVPPLSDKDWGEEFAKYQEFPEYKLLNYHISLPQFKFIYLLEFIHRLVARITGLVYVLPMIYFLLKGEIKKGSIFTYIIVLALFFMQGFMGWYMVKSGLVNHPHVSHFRLAMHLIIAIVIFHLLFYELMKYDFDILLLPAKVNIKLSLLFCNLVIIMIYGQIFLGGLVAGLNAGLVYNTFPLMGNSFIPAEIADSFFSLENLYEPVFVQFIHRVGAYSVFTITFALIVSLLKISNSKLRKLACCLTIVLLLQILTGVIVVLYCVPLIFAIIHQILAVVFLSVTLWCYFLLKSV